MLVPINCIVILENLDQNLHGSCTQMIPILNIRNTHKSICALLCLISIGSNALYHHVYFRHHKKAIRQVCYHKRYPLFASASDDGTVIVCHGMVYK